MKRQHMVTFTTVYKEHEITARNRGWSSVGVFTYSCEALQEEKKYSDGSGHMCRKDFDSLEAILNAIDRYELSLRKDFTNNEAWMAKGWREDLKPVRVHVTSICEDGIEAWIKDEDGQRHKTRIKDNLYNSYEAVVSYCDEIGRIHKQFEKAKDAADKLVGATAQWKPEA